MEKFTNYFTYEGTRSVNIGDVFYCVEITNTEYLREKCKVCNGEKTITVNGVEMPCPVCRGWVHTDTSANNVAIDEYHVKAYRVFAFKVSTPTDYWKESDRMWYEVSLYRKPDCHSSRWSSNRTREVSISLLRLIHELNSEKFNDDKTFYDDYALACKIADELNAAEKEKVEKFNNAFGTAHEYVLKDKNDPKEPKKKGK